MNTRMRHTKLATITALALLTGLFTLSPLSADGAAGPIAKPLAMPKARERAASLDLPLQTPLQRAWDSALAAPSVSHAAVSAYAYDLTTHRPLANIHANWQLTPASVMKLFTSAAALATLGPQFRYQTTVRMSQATVSASPAPILYLVGGGDPWLEADGALDLEHMAKQVAAHVKRAVRVVGVSQLYSGNYTGTGWTWDDLPYNYTPNIAALTAERDQLNLLVSATSRGSRPSITTNPLNPSIDPSSPYLHILNHAQTTGSGPNTLSVSRLAGSNTFVITGNIPVGSQANLFFSLHDPALLAATLFEQLLEKDGVQIALPASTGSLPTTTTPVITHQSPPLSMYLQIQNTYSINLMAENLFRMLGTRNGGNGSGQASATFMTSWEKASGVPVPGAEVDGSGLSPLDELSAQEVVGLLQYAHKQPWFTTFEHSLIHIGQTNQCSFMCGLMDQTAADGNVWIKTGNLGNQWNYAGYAHAKNGDLIAFAVLLDGLSANTFYQQAVGVQDQMTVDAASWPNEPSGPPVPLQEQRRAPAIATQPTLPKLPIPFATGAVMSGEMVDVRSGKVVWSQNAGVRLQPALLPRLALLTAALQQVGGDFGHFTLSANGTVNQGTLRGSLTLSGHGADLSSAQMAQLAHAVQAAGITRVTGNLQYLTTSAGAGPDNASPASLPWEDFGRAFAPAVKDMAANGGTLQIGLTPTSIGHPASLSDPAPSSLVHIVNDTVTAAAGSPSTLSSSWVRGSATYVIQGTVPATAPGQTPPVYTLSIAAPHPGQAAATLLVQALAQTGVHLAGHLTGVTSAPQGRVIATLPAISPTTMVTATLDQPTDATSLALWHALGSAGQSVFANMTGGDDSVTDPSGLGLENYLDANRVAGWLVQIARQQQDHPLYATLQTHGLWTSSSPEEYTVAGYVKKNGHEYAIAVIENGLPWNGHFTPTTGWTSGS
ncbi:MAG: D-alanyl-D-alanine carboxypeptidase/D-alanyl-D-alanine-endopeptidase [Firmicutes bacterium]|nr:D-alanyl-D-alanine carboxypeptidase/D-alanyl-D-alanine-endopeptidase [Bacillota bacterium]